jgi:hypothetical protein
MFLTFSWFANLFFVNSIIFWVWLDLGLQLFCIFFLNYFVRWELFDYGQKKNLGEILLSGQIPKGMFNPPLLN